MGLLCFASQIGCTVAGYLYPAYLSYKALQQQDTFMLQQLLVHWVVIGLYTVAEIIADIFLFWFPFYCQLKLFFVLWLVLPRTCGTMILYQNKILPFFRTNEGQIDETIRVLRSMAWTKLLDLAQIGYAHLHRLALEFLVTLPSSPPSKPDPQNTGDSRGQAAFMRNYMGSLANAPPTPLAARQQQPATEPIAFQPMPAVAFQSVAHPVPHVVPQFSPVIRPANPQLPAQPLLGFPVPTIHSTYYPTDPQGAVAEGALPPQAAFVAGPSYMSPYHDHFRPAGSITPTAAAIMTSDEQQKTLLAERDQLLRLVQETDQRLAWLRGRPRTPSPVSQRQPREEPSPGLASASGHVHSPSQPGQPGQPSGATLANLTTPEHLTPRDRSKPGSPQMHIDTGVAIKKPPSPTPGASQAQGPVKRIAASSAKHGTSLNSEEVMAHLYSSIRRDDYE